MSNEQPTKLDPYMAIPGIVEEGLNWHSPLDEPFQLAGFPWHKEERLYRRLPSQPKHPLPAAVNSLANSTAGGQVRFKTDSKKLTLKVKLAGAANMYHMAATGQCGFDVYIGEPGSQLYCSTTRYDHTKDQFEYSMFDFAENEVREITIYFPLYQGVREVQIGLEKGAVIEAPTPYDKDQPIVVYGTSITQGGCASRSGMAYTNILSRRFAYEFVNLGFSGNGKGEPELAHIINEIPNPACIVLDYEANSGEPGSLAATLPEFIRILRQQNPTTPILVLSRIRYSNEHFNAKRLEAALIRKKIQSDTVRMYREQGDDNIYFHDGSEILGHAFHECTVDGSHPTDLGFYMMAEGLTPVFSKLLQTSPSFPYVASTDLIP